MVHWGRDRFAFEAEPTRIFVDGLQETGEPVLRNGFEMTTAPGALDFEFADFDGDGATELAIVTQSGFCRRWQVSIAGFDGRRVASARVVDSAAPNTSFAFFWVNACDLRNDGDMDLVYEHFGHDFRNVWRTDAGTDTSRSDRFVGLNDGTGRFDRYLLE